MGLHYVCDCGEVSKDTPSGELVDGFVVLDVDGGGVTFRVVVCASCFASIAAVVEDGGAPSVVVERDG